MGHLGGKQSCHLGGVAGEDRRVTALDEGAPDEAEHLGIVIDHEDALHARRRLQRAFGDALGVIRSAGCDRLHGRDGEGELRAVAAAFALSPDPAAVRLHDSLADREAESVSVVALAPGSAVELGELAEQMRHLLCGHPFAFICDDDRDVRAVYGRGHPDRGPLP